jgi:hypothetical protein
MKNFILCALNDAVLAKGNDRVRKHSADRRSYRYGIKFKRGNYNTKG